MMNKPILVIGILAALTTATAAAATATVTAPADEAAIRQIQASQADAWNLHDASAYAELFSHDGEVVNVLGWWWQGRAQIESKLVAAFAWVFRDSRMTIDDVQVRMLAPTLAIAHVRWTMEGAKAPPGAAQPPRQGLQLQVLRKEHGHWLITSFQNTNALPERPFPRGPPESPSPTP
jgi:uncharacterized protein (TIGR02246 family)